MQKPKSKVFKDLYPQILKLKSEGYTDQVIIDHLKEKYNLELSYGTFTNYLHRNKTHNPLLDKKTELSATTNKPENPIFETKTPIQSNESSEQPIKKRKTWNDVINEGGVMEQIERKTKQIQKEHLQNKNK